MTETCAVITQGHRGPRLVHLPVYKSSSPTGTQELRKKKKVGARAREMSMGTGLGGGVDESAVNFPSDCAVGET